ncbi:MAG: hypothetical protein EOM50_04795 [Erysipelotrichia bacterium]|nr:hypothetical protein [Erysipelotrichia bacterium]NCC54784.1 hypothetical protein [Erysipelotrichia bacterium]
MYYEMTSLKAIKAKKDRYIALYDIKEDKENLYEEFDQTSVEEVLSNRNITYEDHVSFEVISFLKDKQSSSPNQHVYVFIKKDSLHFVGDKKYLLAFIEHLKTIGNEHRRGIGFILYQFLLMVIFDYREQVDRIENEISLLEDEILAKDFEERQYSKRILYYRKKLLLRKRRYEQILDVIDYLLDNNNDVYEQEELVKLTILKDRVNRMMSQVISLLEYVTEVREAYQSAVDTKQNKIMSLFTVITSIFLPLSLIAGWYGMNLKMPEFQFVYAYPIVIIISLLIVVFCIYYFKKKKWF